MHISPPFFIFYIATWPTAPTSLQRP